MPLLQHATGVLPYITSPTTSLYFTRYLKIIQRILYNKYIRYLVKSSFQRIFFVTCFCSVGVCLWNIYSTFESFSPFMVFNKLWDYQLQWGKYKLAHYFSHSTKWSQKEFLVPLLYICTVSMSVFCSLTHEELAEELEWRIAQLPHHRDKRFVFLTDEKR